jgi:predicted RNA-binding Zn-ribbon protein involved in translation (DUF1610 family)
MTVSENSYAPGFPCPECGRPIVVAIHQLLSPSPIVCPGCGLELTVAREQSPVLTYVQELSETLARIPDAESAALPRPGKG